ncbi:hypothetical protein FQN53_000535 [Emmonsiellopsis sp. PD_33]|nr:hypothetical protein FQN53_000535 [Emmonsiellopsis sp. PD_33]
MSAIPETFSLLEENWEQGYDLTLVYSSWIKRHNNDAPKIPEIDNLFADMQNPNAVGEYEVTLPLDDLAAELTLETRTFLGYPSHSDRTFSAHLALGPKREAPLEPLPPQDQPPSWSSPLCAKFGFVNNEGTMIQIGGLRNLNGLVPKCYYIFRAWEENRNKICKPRDGLKRYVIANVKGHGMTRILLHEYNRLEATAVKGMITAQAKTTDLEEQAAFYTLLGSPYVTDVLRSLIFNRYVPDQRDITEIRVQRVKKTDGETDRWDIILEIGEWQRLARPILPPKYQSVRAGVETEYSEKIRTRTYSPTTRRATT